MKAFPIRPPDLPGKLERAKALSIQVVEKPLESSRGPEPSRTTIVPGGVNGGDGRVFAAGIRRIQAKTGEGGRGGGACFPVHPLVKNLF